MLHLFVGLLLFQEYRSIVLCWTSFKPASEHSLDNFWQLFDFSLIFLEQFSPIAMQWWSFLHESRPVSSSIFSKRSSAASFPGALKSLGASLYKSATALIRNKSPCGEATRCFSSLPLQCIDLFPPPLLRNSPL